MLVENSRKNILKTTSLVGASNIITILLSILRVKVIAVLIGPSGVGIMGIFQNLVDLIKSITNLGINYSGVKEIASTSNDNSSLSKSLLILKRWSLASGIFGMLLTIIFSFHLSIYSFGNSNYTVHIILLSITILLSSVSGVQLAILQGLLRISDMIKASLYASIVSTFIIIPLYYFFGIKAIVPGIVIISIISLIFSWYYTRNVLINKITLSIKETFKEGINIIRLGFFITLSGLISNLTLYLVRIILLKKSDLLISGAFQASWTITTLFLSIFLSPMLLEFYPRLSKEPNDNDRINVLINEQQEITTLLASPVIITIVAISKFIINILYSKDFAQSIPILQWQMIGTFFIIISWPLGVLFLAKNKGNYSFITEVIRLILFILIILIGFDRIGISVIGIAYLLSNILTCAAIYIFTFKMVRFNYDKNNLTHIVISFLLLLTCVLNVFYIKNLILQTIVSAIVISVSITYSLKVLNRILNFRLFIANKLKLIKNKLNK